MCEKGTHSEEVSVHDMILLEKHLFKTAILGSPKVDWGTRSPQTM